MPPRPSAANSVSNARAGQAAGPGFGPQSGTVSGTPPLAEGVARLNLLQLLTDPPRDDGDADRPDVVSSTTTRNETGSVTKVTFDDGSTLVIDRVKSEDGFTTIHTRTDAEGTVVETSKEVTRLNDDHVQTIITGPDATRTVTVNMEEGTRTIDIVRTDGDHLTITQERADNTVSGTWLLVEADGDKGSLDYSLTRDGTTQTLDVEGTTADGVAVDSIVLFDADAGTVKVTDAAGDVATFTLAAFRDGVADTGLIGLIADVDSGYFG